MGIALFLLCLVAENSATRLNEISFDGNIVNRMLNSLHPIREKIVGGAENYADLLIMECIRYTIIWGWLKLQPVFNTRDFGY